MMSAIRWGQYYILNTQRLLAAPFEGHIGERTAFSLGEITYLTFGGLPPVNCSLRGLH